MSSHWARTAKPLTGWRGDGAGRLRRSDDPSNPYQFTTVPQGSRVLVCGRWPTAAGWLHLAIEHPSGNVHIPALPDDIGAILYE